VVVGGEARIGKSRLVATFADDVGGSGARVLVGGCLRSGPGASLRPFVEAFRALFRDVDPGALPALLGPSRGELARLMPRFAADLTGRTRRHRRIHSMAMARHRTSGSPRSACSS
jgi:hypothetical protein